MIGALIFILILSYLTYHQQDFYMISLDGARLAAGHFDLYQGGNLGRWGTHFAPLAKWIDGIIYAALYYTGIIRVDYTYLAQNFYPGQLNVLLLKLRYVVAFLISVNLMKRIADVVTPELAQKKIIYLLWLLCPAVLFLQFAQGNNDIYMIIWLLLFLLMAVKQRPIWALVFLGLAAAVKIFPVFVFLPVAIILAQKDWRKSILYFLIPCAVVFLTMSTNLDFASSFLIVRQEGFSLFQNSLFGSALVFPAAYVMLMGWLLFMEKAQHITSDVFAAVLKYTFLFMSLMFVTGQFLPQWFLWILPFFILLVYKNKQLFLIYALLLISFFAGLMIEWSGNLDAVLFGYTWPILLQVPSLWETVFVQFPGLHLLEISRTVFVSIYGFFLFMLLRHPHGTSESAQQPVTWKLVLAACVAPFLVYAGLNAVYYGYMIKTHEIKSNNTFAVDLWMTPQARNLGPIDASTNFYQSFTATFNHLRGLRLLVANYGTSITTPYSLYLYTADCGTLISMSPLSISDIPNNQEFSVIFPEIPQSAGQIYCFTVKPNTAQVITPLTIWLANANEYSEGSLQISSLPQADDLFFKPIYLIKP